MNSLKLLITVISVYSFNVVFLYLSLVVLSSIEFEKLGLLAMLLQVSLVCSFECVGNKFFWCVCYGGNKRHFTLRLFGTLDLLQIMRICSQEMYVNTCGPPPGVNYVMGKQISPQG